MPRFAANVSTMFPDLPVAERFAAARAIGFQAVEYLFPYGESPGDIRHRLRDAGIRMILLNTPIGDAGVGCGYRPMTTTAAGLSWGRPYGLGRNP